MQNVFLSLIVICMYLSVFVVIISVGFDSVYGLENTATWNTPDGFTINYPSDWLIDQYERTYGESTWKIISFFNEQDTASINLDREFYPNMFFTLDQLYHMFDNPEKYGGQASDLSKVDSAFSFFIALELAKIFQCDYNYEEDYGCTDLKPKALRFFENDGGLPALQVEYSSTSKSYGDNTTYGYSSLATIYYLQDRLIILFSQSLLTDYGQLRPYFVDAANSFTLADNAENKLSEKTKLRLLSDMKSFPNSNFAKIMNDTLKQAKGYSIPIIEYGQISLETTEVKNSKGDAFTSISTLIQYDIPSWVKGVANFWAEGNISDSEFGEALSFLIANEIIKVPKIQELQNEITQLKAENSELRAKLNLPEPEPEPTPKPEPEPTPEPEPEIVETTAIFEVDAGGRTYDVEYAIKGGTVTNMMVDYDRFTLTVLIASDEGGTITLDLPRKLIDTKKQDGKDDTFIILTRGVEVSYQESDFDFVSRVITVNFEKRDAGIQIIGTELIGIDSDSPPPPNISITNPKVVDAFGNEINTSVNVSQLTQIVIDITNHNYFEQPFNYHITIRGTGYEESISGSLSGGQSFSPGLTWIPTEAGIFTADISVFDNIQNENKLTDSVTLQIRVS